VNADTLYRVFRGAVLKWPAVPRKKQYLTEFLRASSGAVRLGKSSSNLFRDRKKIQAQRLMCG
jgi:hypothetical protein